MPDDTQRDMPDGDPAARGSVTVKLFAALRDAAGTGEVRIETPVDVAGICRDLSTRFGPRFAERLTIAAVMVDGTPVDRDSTAALRPGAEVALLPPFAGGQR